MEFKRCNECGAEYPKTIEWFYKSKITKDGFRGKCKKCTAEYAHEYKEQTQEWLKINKEKISETDKKYREKNKERIAKRKKQYYKNNKDKIAEHAKQYHDSNKEKIHAQQKNYREKNKEKLTVHRKQYRQYNLDKHCINEQRRRAIKKQTAHTLTEAQWQEIKNYFNNECAYCGKSVKLTQDHFIPISKGGEYTHNNIIPACEICNSSKNSNDFFKWYQKQNYYSQKRKNKILKFLNYNNQSQTQQLFII